jgi:hypothetical protein
MKKRWIISILLLLWWNEGGGARSDTIALSDGIAIQHVIYCQVSASKI